LVLSEWKYSPESEGKKGESKERGNGKESVILEKERK
jgi:hypothetical protein